MSRASTHTVDDELAGKTLLAALRHWDSTLSWKAARELLAKRQVLVNGVLCFDEARRLQPGESVLVSDTSRPKSPGNAQIGVRYLDEHILVVEKPAGMLTERPLAEQSARRSRSSRIPSLDELLPRVIAEFEAPSRLRHEDRLFIVHRLDRDASGLLVVARTAAARDGLIQQFAARSPNRTYWAVVCGNVAAQTIRTHLLRDRGDGRRGSVEAMADQSNNARQEGQLAITHVTPIRSRRGLTLLECRLETGRTNQIRIHLAELGHPILGDVKYGSPTDDQLANRLALHAIALEFKHPITGVDLCLESDWPDEIPLP